MLIQNALDDHMSQLISVGSSSIKSAGSVAVSVINAVFDTLIEIVLVMTIAVFFSLEKNAVNSFLGRVSGRPVYVHHQLQKLSEKLGLWLE